MASLAGPLPDATGRAKPRKASRIWWHVHQWAGLKLSIFLAFVFATGTLAVLSNEIDWLLQPSLRVAPSTVAGEPSWDRIAAAALAHPSTAKLNAIDAPIAPFFAARATIERADGKLAFLDIHPATGVVQGEANWVGAQRVLRNMHRHLNLPVWIGVPIVSIAGILLLVSTLTSLVVYKRWWRGFWKPVRWRNARTALGDLHRLMGVWSLAFALLIGATSIWYLVESLGLDAPRLPTAKAAKTSEPASLARTFPAALAAARAANPDLRIERIVWPRKAGQPLSIQGQDSAILVRERANAVLVDPATARVLRVGDGAELSTHQRISEAADPLHFGNFGGYWTKIPWFLFGLALTGLSVTGIAIYGTRVAHGTRSATLTAWSGMGRWRWPALAAMAVALALLPMLFMQADWFG